MPHGHKLHILLILIGVAVLAILPSSCSCNCSSDSDGIGGDWIPDMSAITISNVTGRSATITWHTNYASTGMVEYGTTTSYGLSKDLGTVMTNSHSVTLAGLHLNTTYHFRVKSQYSSEGVFVSDDNTFTTLAEPVTYTVGIRQFPTMDNPFSVTGTDADAAHIGIMYEPLVHYNNRGEVLPLLANTWSYDAATTTWTFNIDPRAAWSDGRPVTAADVKFTYEKVWELDLGQGDETIDLVETVTAVDNRTVTFTLAEPRGNFPALLSDVVIVPQHVWGEMTQEEIVEYPNRDPVGSGAWALDTGMGTDLIYDARQDYWGGAPKIDVFVKKYYGTDQAQLLALMSGEIDACTDYPTTAVPRLLWNNDITVYQVDTNATASLHLNHSIEPFNLKQFRQALNIGIDRANLVNFAADGWAMPVPNMIEVSPLQPHSNPAALWPYANYSHAQRIDLANAALDEIDGITPATPDRVDGEVPAFQRQYDGEPLEFELLIISDSYNAIAELIVNDLEELGIKVIVEELKLGGAFPPESKPTHPPDDWQSTITRRQLFHDYDYFARQWQLYDDDDPVSTFRYSYIAGWTGEAAEAISAKLVQLQALPMGDAMRDALIQETQALIAEELPCIPLYHPVEPHAYRTDRFTGWVVDQGLQLNGNVPSVIGPINLLSIEPL